MEGASISPFEEFRYPEGERTEGPNGNTLITTPEGHKYDIYKLYHYDNLFIYESDDLREIFQEVEPGNTINTEEMYAYEPKEAVLVYGKFKSRLIFYNQEFDDEEKELLRKFRELCKSKNIPIPDCDPEILKALYTAKFNLNTALTSLLQKTDFVNTKLPARVGPGTFELLNMGVFEILGRDRSYRPIFMVNIWKLDQLPVKPEPEVMIATALTVQEYVTKYMMIPGRVENAIFIGNPGGKGIMSLPVSLLKAIAGILMMFYKCRVRTQFIINASYAFNMFFSIMKNFLDYNTKQKI